MKEIWKDIKSYEGLYQVSNIGRIKSLKRHIKTYNGGEYVRKEKIKSIRKINTGGYSDVLLAKNGKNKTFVIHRLVAEAFIPNPQNLPYINHKDEDKTNNCVENLEWCDPKYNANYGNAIKKRVKKMYVKVEQYSIDGKLIKVWNSIREASEKLKIKNQSITRCCQGKRKTTGGYIWRYRNRKKYETETKDLLDI